MYPDFLGIGAQKAGTTWLQRNLRAHPEIWMPKEKEIHYFDEKIRLKGGLWSRLRGDRPADVRWRRQARMRFKRSRISSSPRDIAWDLRYFLMKPSDRWYASLFEPGAGKMTGEATPDYSILKPRVIAHVHEIMPDAKIIFLMRNPVERPWSATDMGIRLSGQSAEKVPDEKFYRQFDSPRVRLLTNYLRTLRSWGTHYPQDQIFVGFLEDIHFFPEEFLVSLYDFLGVEPFVDERIVRRKIHSGFQSTMPTRFAVHLARTYREDLVRMDRRFGGYASFWLYCAERLIEDPPKEESVPYPLWESEMWEEWKEPREIALQSGPLSTLRSAS